MDDDVYIHVLKHEYKRPIKIIRMTFKRKMSFGEKLNFEISKNELECIERIVFNE